MTSEFKVEVTPMNELHQKYLKFYDYIALGLHDCAKAVAGYSKGSNEERCYAVVVANVNIISAKCIAHRGLTKSDRETLKTVLDTEMEEVKPRRTPEDVVIRGYVGAKNYGGELVPREIPDADNEIDQIWVDETRRVQRIANRVLEIGEHVVRNGTALCPKESEAPPSINVRAMAVTLNFVAARLCKLSGNLDGELDNISHITKARYEEILAVHKRLYPEVYV